MSRFLRFGSIPVLALAVLLSTAGCKSKQDQNAANANPAVAQDSSSDPAAANLAPVSTDTGAPAPAPSGAQQSAAPPEAASSSAPAPEQSADDSGYGEQPVATAPQPPPALPDYEQPAAPGDDYLWTPGYWGYASSGYYWVPGVWAQAPYEGALWTPGYWGWAHNHYGFYRGYWGPHIGFYGGVNYGFGYVGTGYQGGYWNTGHFYSNRAVNNINVTVVHNVYNRTVANSAINAHVSFNGGQGGIQVRARPAELAALREPHAPPMRAQVANEHAASTNRAQFASVNHGRPASLVAAKPLVADRDVHPVAPPAARNQPGAQPRGPAEAHPNAAQPAHGNEPAGKEPARPEAAPHAAPHAEPEANKARPEERTAPSKAAPQKPAPHAQPEAGRPKPEEKSAPGKAAPQRSAPEKSAPGKPAPQKPAPHEQAKPAQPKHEEEKPR